MASEEAGIHIAIAPEKLGEIWGIPVTNTIWVIFLVDIILISLVYFACRKPKSVPGKLQLFVESVFDGFYNFMLDILDGNVKAANLLFPLLITVMLFFLVANMLPYFPGIGAITFQTEEGVQHLFRPASTDYNIVLGLTLLCFSVIQLSTIVSGGIKHFFKKYFNIFSPMDFFVGVIEFVGEHARIVSLSFRFFGNLFAEEVLGLVILFLAPYVAPIPFTILGIGISVIQPIIFVMLVLIFTKLNIYDRDSGH